MDPQLVIVFAILGITVVLIVTEVFRIDVVAIIAMLALAWTGSITPQEARSGFLSNAVLALFVVMIIRTGPLQVGNYSENRQLHPQDCGPRASSHHFDRLDHDRSDGRVHAESRDRRIFLPVMTGISKREKISISSLLMPLGFAALIGGSLTVVGTSSLIVLNDPLKAQATDAFGLFAVLPIGIVFLIAGVLYFLVLGPYVLPSGRAESDTSRHKPRLLNVWGLSDSIYTFRTPAGSSLSGQFAEESKMGAEYNINLLKVYDDEESEYDIWEEMRFREGQEIIVQGRRGPRRRLCGGARPSTRRRERTLDPRLQWGVSGGGHSGPNQSGEENAPRGSATGGVQCSGCALL